MKEGSFATIFEGDTISGAIAVLMLSDGHKG